MKRALERKAPPLGASLEFLRLLWEVDHALQRRSKRMQKEIGATGPQRLVLRIVGRFPGLPTGELATLLHVHPSTVTGILDRLEEKKWIERRAHPSDGRSTLIGLTARGRAFDSADPASIESALQRVRAETSEADIATTARVLRSVARALD